MSCAYFQKPVQLRGALGWGLGWKRLSDGPTSKKVMFFCLVLGSERLKGSWQNLCVKQREWVQVLKVISAPFLGFLRAGCKFSIYLWPLGPHLGSLSPILSENQNYSAWGFLCELRDLSSHEPGATPTWQEVALRGFSHCWMQPLSSQLAQRRCRGVEPLTSSCLLGWVSFFGPMSRPHWKEGTFTVWYS